MAIAIKKPKLGKLKSYPKKPKNETLKSMEGWLERCKAVFKDNAVKRNAYYKEVGKWEAKKKRINSIKDQVQSMKNKERR
jgi:hypothetical protein